jgi:hypothetical protein
MEQRLVLEDLDGKVVRAFQWSGEPVQVIRRHDTRRLELIENLEELEEQNIAFENLGLLQKEGIQKNPLLVGKLGQLKIVETVEATDLDSKNPEENKKVWRNILLVLAALSVTWVVVLSKIPHTLPKIEEELKQQVVKIVKNIKHEVTTQPRGTIKDSSTKPTKTVSIKRMGALSALGSLQSSKQKSGLNLGAAQTTAGPGLGGTAGSGGVQTNIYAKGIVSAPLGVGGNVQGAGGYGTKGKGGGQAGYGKLSLVGSTGASTLPLGAEADVAQGLDRDQIAAVINRNLGQVRFCYEQGLQSDASLNGRVSIGFTIGGNGLVKSAQIDNTTLNAKAVEECLLLRLKTWKFPLPEGGVDVKVSYPFVLRRSGQG